MKLFRYQSSNSDESVLFDLKKSVVGIYSIGVLFGISLGIAGTIEGGEDDFYEWILVWIGLGGMSLLFFLYITNLLLPEVKNRFDRNTKSENL